VRRRDLITVLGGAAVVWPIAARAQQSQRMRLIGVLEGQADGPLTRTRNAVFRETLERLGWTQDGNVRIDYRFAGGDVQKAQAFAKELIHGDISLGQALEDSRARHGILSKRRPLDGCRGRAAGGTAWNAAAIGAVEARTAGPAPA